MASSSFIIKDIDKLTDDQILEELLGDSEQTELTFTIPADSDLDSSDKDESAQGGECPGSSSLPMEIATEPTVSQPTVSSAEIDTVSQPTNSSSTSDASDTRILVPDNDSESEPDDSDKDKNWNPSASSDEDIDDEIMIENVLDDAPLSPDFIECSQNGAMFTKKLNNTYLKKSKNQEKPTAEDLN
ncbi:hypothetical protein LSTR_LSTR002848 [Laodelphax striatellus]|uniref:Uncharacterized protein n=1 Tax=Laodelphax striatellus TaxID=195883 RepID=A0A482XH94_LAOST|nr:hypothetical protein LSTR_LSTR002848 [Laodelphax striatellus]